MGSIRPNFIKTAARKLLRYYPDEFTTDFETNKRLVEQYSDAKTKRVRNRIAGYLVRLITIEQTRAEAEAMAAAQEEQLADMEM
ncbi:MAG: 30S ribosomal protein S17e [Candidatus Thorarchaeota archaeon]